MSEVGRFLKERKPSVEVFPVEPFESSVINGLPHSPHKIQGEWKGEETAGMGTGFIPAVLQDDLFHEVLRVHLDDTMAIARRLPKEEGLLVGISSNANVCAAIQVSFPSASGDSSQNDQTTRAN